MVRRISREQQRRNHREAVGVLHEAQVAVLKWRILQGESKGELAKEYDVSLWTIRAIAKGHTWSDVLPVSPGDDYKSPLSELMDNPVEFKLPPEMQLRHEALVWETQPEVAAALGYEKPAALVAKLAAQQAKIESEVERRFRETNEAAAARLKARGL